MTKPQPKQETILLEEEDLKEQVEELLGPYLQRIFSDRVWVLPITPEDEKQNAPSTEVWQ